MKKNIENEIIIILKKIYANLKKGEKSKDFSKKVISNGLLEWSNEESQFFKLKKRKSDKSTNLLFLENFANILKKNTLQFLNGKPANSVLLWGARGTGKSSLVMSIFNELSEKFSFSMIEIKFFQLQSLPKILRICEKEKNKIIIFCDDFSFQLNDEKFILFKNVLEGSLRQNSNILFYVTSNFRHLVKDYLNIDSNILHKKDVNENLVSLSDRFGIWMGFHSFSLEQYLKIVFSYANIYNIKIQKKIIRKKAIQWSIERGSYSGREAVNFIKFIMLNS